MVSGEKNKTNYYFKIPITFRHVVFLKFFYYTEFYKKSQA